MSARPILPDRFRKKSYQIRFSDEEIKKIDELKEFYNCPTRSDYLRKAALRELKPPPKNK
jgi:hypothetical protein